MRLGLIGAGRWGRIYIKTLARMQGTVLAHLASSNPESAALVPTGCEISDDWRKVVTDPSLDGVILASPPETHAPLALAAIEAGNPVLIEKPMALNPQEARAVLDAAEDVLVMVGHTHLFGSAFRTLQAENTIDTPVLSTRARAGNRGPVRPDATVLWDWAPHDIAMCLELFGGAPETVEARIERREEFPEGVGEAVAIRLGFSDNRSSEIVVSNIEPVKVRTLELSFGPVEMLYDDLAKEKLCRRVLPGGQWETVEIEPTLPLTSLVHEFCASIERGVTRHSSLELGVRVIEVLSECERQLETAAPRGSVRTRGR